MKAVDILLAGTSRAGEIPPVGTVDLGEGNLAAAGIALLGGRGGKAPGEILVAPDDDALPPPRKESLDLLKGLSDDHLEFWLEECAKHGKALPPDHVVRFMDQAVRHPEIAASLLDCDSPRVQWLARLNPRWKNLVVPTLDEWDESTTAERRRLIRKLFRVDPAKARELIRNMGTSSSAAERSELLGDLGKHLCDEDLTTVEAFLQDRSSTVRQAAGHLAVRLPRSRVVQEAWERSKNSLIIHEHRLRKDTLEVSAPLDEQGTASTTLLWEDIEKIPPSWWEDHLGKSPDELVTLAAVEENLILAWIRAAVVHQDAAWAVAISKRREVLNTGLMAILPDSEAVKQVKHLQVHLNNARSLKGPLGPLTSRALFHQAVKLIESELELGDQSGVPYVEYQIYYLLDPAVAPELVQDEALRTKLTLIQQIREEHP